jgi:hypothetical protein
LALLLSKERAADYKLLATMIEAGQVVPSVAITVTHGSQR